MQIEPEIILPYEFLAFRIISFDCIVNYLQSSVCWILIVCHSDI